MGTRSILYGAHCWFIHPWFVARAWWKLFGFPVDPRLWLCFWLHDLALNCVSQCNPYYLNSPRRTGPQ